MNDSVLTELKIIFDDKEYVVVPVNYVLSLNVSGIQESRHIKRKKSEPLIFKSKYAEMIDIEIAKEAADKIFTSRGTELFKKIRNNKDITKIELKYSDGTEEVICADYSADFTTGENEWQKSNTINGGRLAIFIHNPAAISY